MVEALAKFGVVFVEGGGVIAAFELFLDLGGGEAEEEEVIGADGITDFDIGAVEGSDGECAVEGELHVTGSGGFFTGGGDLL
ncbi:MAG: hypothetical protein RI897_1418 [Verrucomicrobiota bacterium]